MGGRPDIKDRDSSQPLAAPLVLIDGGDLGKHLLESLLQAERAQPMRGYATNIINPPLVRGRGVPGTKDRDSSHLPATLFVLIGWGDFVKHLMETLLAAVWVQTTRGRAIIIFQPTHCV